MAEFWIKTGDLLPWVTSTLTDGSGAPVDIENADVYFTLRPIRSDTPVVDRVLASNDQTGDGSDGSLGTVHYEWTSGDTDLAGGYYAEWTVDFTTSGVMSFPNNGHDTVAIVQTLEQTGS